MSSKQRFIRGLVLVSIGLVLLILSLYSLGIFGKGGSAEFKKEYGEDIVPNNLYKYVGKEEVLELFEKGTGILYFGYPESPWCKRAVSVLNDAAFANGIKEVYYYNIKRDRDSLSLNEDGTVSIDANATNFYNELLRKLAGHTDKYILLDKDGKEVDTGRYRIYVPFVVFIKEGRIVYSHSDLVDSYTDTNEGLTQDQRDELYNIYEKGILLINNSQN